ncbi:restriction endonuclease subunit S [Escherichia coli]|uniref:restriction endonuclease subunit S n=1 Tax=Escherichia coli TaxID=562 RepID=UPI0021157D56|nr:restriction endonuclease subunit S [Escherichia coli]HEB1635204.1 restriction endonuclease subunit S [Escherichia albertii]UUD50859.1 restriction endonuclease subunit S [Escherichia coli]HCJ5560333.1 restriction endonuclease subunit S [Escherichia coli]HCJ6123821.1 restriction endonuclease subunit S [Escherichia coli]HCJ6155744.1 restriction endonuclease subunit S [Escherichia coli]
MSELSYLEKLLDGVEVKWLPLGHIAAIKTGQSVNKNMISKNPGVYPVINSGREPLGFINTWNTDNDPIGITTRGAGVGSVIWQEGKYFRGNLNYSITIDKKSHINIRYMYHALLHMKNDIHELCTFDGIPALNAGSLKKLLIPIPCPNIPEKSLAIQSEIVRILDKFTALTAELTAELTMRKKQYNYYRDQLLSFEDGEVEWKTLEEVLVDKFWIMPATPKFDDNGEIPYVTSKNISGGNIDFERVKHISRDDFLSISKNRPILKGDFLISMIGTIGEIARVKCLDPDFYGQNMYLIRLNEELLHPRYFLHFFDSPRMKFYFKSVKNNSGQGYLKANNIDGLSIPLPSIDEQQKIAFILDKFDTLTNPINEGLPREIELRQKQYEYYRDLLFSFPKPDTVNQ